MLEYKEIITYIFAIGAAQAIFLFFILLKKKENSFANKFLAITMLVFALDLLAGVAFLSGFIRNIPWVMGLGNSFPYLYGPLIYLYVIFLTQKKESFEFKNLIHFIPFLLVQIYGLFFFYFEPSEYQLSLLDFTKLPPWHIKLVGMIIPFVGVFYLFLTVRKTIEFNKLIKNSFSSIEDIDLSWLLYLVFWAVIIWTIVVLSYIIGFTFGDQLQANLSIYISISIFLYVFAIKVINSPK